MIARAWEDMAARASRVASTLLLGLITLYRVVVTPWLPPRCRFAPSCSAYAAEAIERFGPLEGARLAILRVARCHPWHAGGHDPVPAVDCKHTGHAHPAADRRH